MALAQIHAQARKIVVTTGSRHAVVLATRVFIAPGDVGSWEHPTTVQHRHTCRTATHWLDALTQFAAPHFSPLRCVTFGQVVALM